MAKKKNSSGKAGRPSNEDIRKQMADREAELRARGEWDDSPEAAAKESSTEPVATEIPEPSTTIEVEASHHPLSAPTVDRSYSRAQVSDQPMADLPEPTVAPPTMEQVVAKEQAAQAAQPVPPANPVMNQLDDKDKKIAAEQAVDMALDAYDALHQVPQALARFDDNKLREMEAEGKLDPNEMIPYDTHPDGTVKSISIMQFTKSYNEQVTEALSPSKKFRDDIREPLIRIFIKRGIAVTDEQFVVGKVLKDVVSKGVVGFNMHRSFSRALDTFSQAYVNRMGGVPPDHHEQPAHQEEVPASPPQAPIFSREAPEILDLTKMTDEQIQQEADRRRQQMEKFQQARDREKQGVEAQVVEFGNNPLRDGNWPEGFEKPEEEKQ